MSKIVQKLKAYLDYRDISVSTAEREIGASNATLSKAFKNGTAIKTDTLEKFLNLYSEIDSNWILKDKGDMIEKKEINLTLDNPNPIRDKLITTQQELLEYKDNEIKELKKQISDLKKGQKQYDYHSRVAEERPELK